MSINNILVADDEESMRWVLSKALKKKGFAVDLAVDGDEALKLIRAHTYDLAILDIKMPGLSGLELLDRVRELKSELLVVIMTAEASMKNAVEAMKRGAYDYITKPFHVAELRTKLDRLVHSIELDQENRLLREQLRSKPGFGGLIGVSPKMQGVYKSIEKVAQHTYPVLILGESGTGKERVARSIHFSGPRSHKPFSPVACSSLSPTLTHSGLFEYVNGAFGTARRFQFDWPKGRRRSGRS